MDISESIPGNSLDSLEAERRAKALAQRAMHIRKRIAAKKPITDAQRDWLTRYESEHPSRRPVRSAPPMPQPPTLPGIEINIDGVENAPIENSSNVVSGDVSQKQSNTTSEENRPNQGTSNGANGEQAKPVDEETRKAAYGLAGLYGEWLKLASKQCVDMGGYGIPTKLVDEMIVPATARVAMKYLPSMDSPMADEIIVAASGAGMVVQRTMLRRRHAQQKPVVDVPPEPAQQAKNGKPPNQPPTPIRALVQRHNPLDVEIG